MIHNFVLLEKSKVSWQRCINCESSKGWAHLPPVVTRIDLPGRHHKVSNVNHSDKQIEALKFDHLLRFLGARAVFGTWPLRAWPAKSGMYTVTFSLFTRIVRFKNQV